MARRCKPQFEIGPFGDGIAGCEGARAGARARGEDGAFEREVCVGQIRRSVVPMVVGRIGEGDQWCKGSRLYNEAPRETVAQVQTSSRPSAASSEGQGLVLAYAVGRRGTTV